MNFKNSIVTKFIWRTMLFSTVITMPFIIGNLFFEYNNEIKNIEHSFEQFERSGLETLSMSVWYIDRNQVNKQLEGLINITPFSIIEVKAPIIGNIEFQSNSEPNGPTKTFNLVYEKNQLGTITIKTSLTPLIKNLTWRFFLIFSSVILNTAIVAGFIIYLFRKTITNPLSETTERIQKITFDQSLLLNELSYINELNSQKENLNELESVNESVIKLQHNFQNSYLDLLKTKERLNDIIDFASDAIFETDADLNFNEISFAKKLRLDGLNSYLEINKNLLELPFNDQAKKELILHHNFIETNINIDEYFTIVIKAITDSENNFKGYRGIIFNITSKVQIENKLKDQSDQIFQMQKITAIGELTASLAHDFRNFLSIVIYTNEWILRIAKDEDISIRDEKFQMHINNAQSASIKADHLITKLLDFSRRHISKPESVHLYTQLLSLKEILHVAITKRFALEITELNPTSFCTIDSNMFESAILNLCVNAKDALKEKGKVTIELSQIEIKNHSKLIDGNYILLKFSDNGKGMPIEVQEKIFEPFFTTKTEGKGTGLGLSMIYNFMLSSKGIIEVQSIENVGTSFYLYFPAISS